MYSRSAQFKKITAGVATFPNQGTFSGKDRFCCWMLFLTEALTHA